MNLMVQLDVDEKLNMPRMTVFFYFDKVTIGATQKDLPGCKRSFQGDIGAC
jgi:hypothetical protein